MRVVITGAAGFLGSRLARAILARGSLTDSRGNLRPVRELVLADIAAPPPSTDERVRTMAGNLSETDSVDSVITPETNSVFHLAAIVSAEAEADFDIGMRVNVDATRSLLERCRACVAPPKFVFASSLAVFGGAVPDPVPDNAPLMPQTSYGTQKAIGELLVNDMSRKGFIDGRSLRLPTVVVRPGKPNKAASSFASSIIRDPLAGIDVDCPVARTTRMWLASPATVVDNIIRGHEAPAEGFTYSRSINLPGISVAVEQMVDCLRRVAGDEVAARVRWNYDAAIDRIVSTWPARFEATAARTLGMRQDQHFESVIRAHIADSGIGLAGPI
ncbi:MAG TPA: D-erythronate dehydrogenase [Casimicrobiaceae bacterium]|nr:D-erythronate dehydrogenase [Casimicrobiaceae bacterium]